MKFRAEIEAMLDPRKWPMGWVEARIADGSIALLENDQAVIGVERRVYPGGLVELHGMFAAGDLPAIMDLVAAAVEGGKATGCDTAAISSRIGWAKPFKELGFNVEQQVLTKDLRDGT